MKKLAIILAFVAVFASSCKQSDSPYITEPTKLNFVIDELSDGFVSIRIIPKDYRAYYFIAPIMNTEQFVELGLTNEHFMMLCIDQTYTDYLEWRHPYLYDSVPYI